jgi:hypothetical protein
MSNLFRFVHLNTSESHISNNLKNAKNYQLIIELHQKIPKAFCSTQKNQCKQKQKNMLFLVAADRFVDFLHFVGNSLDVRITDPTATTDQAQSEADPLVKFVENLVD